MLEAYKRELTRTWCEAVTAAPFVASINANERPAEASATWFTVSWAPDHVEPIGYCGVNQETGLFNVHVAGAPNLGDAAVAAACDAIVAELMAMVDPQAALTLERAGAPSEDSNGSADRWYRLVVPIEYRLISGG